jgi:NAD(P)-dependent dehydrogenase (short-subunit alcohol dehydrogenase family)
MKVIVIGATGTIGTAVARSLAEDHQVVRVGHARGDYQVDLGSKTSIERLYGQLAPVDAVVSVAGNASFGALDGLTDDDFQLALGNKLMGQVNLVRLGLDRLRDGGSFTLTSGLLAREPMVGSASISMANGAIESFVAAAALELPRGLRINAVSPIFVKETMVAMGMDSTGGLSAQDTAQAYVESVTGRKTGQVLDVRDFVKATA